MAIVLPFKAVRPKKEFARDIAAPPYDVVNSDEARELAQGNDKSYLHISRPEIDLDPRTDEHADQVYGQGKINFEKFKTNGWLFQEQKPCFYIYKQIMGGHQQIGLVAVASAEDYDKDVIKKHEHTRPDKEDDRTRHIGTINANTEPVFFTYPAVPTIDSMINDWIKQTPEYDFTSDDGVKHTLWVCDDDQVIEALRSEFAKMKYMYVADGHHRSAAAWRLWKERKAKNPKHTGNEEYNFFLTVIFPDNQMNIMAYNRVVKDLNGNSKDEFLEKLGRKFTVSEKAPDVPGANLKFSMYLDGKWHLLAAKDGSYDDKDPVKRLDASILQDNLLHPVLGIDNPRTDQRINFVGGIRGTRELVKLVDSGKYAVAFSLHPVNIRQLISVADSGQVMPPKSTWFEPKLRSGLFVHQYD
ncbi:MAG: hypothetical protein A2509_07105 [Candidatus Edwardsbacteria bacterium RIFOXYD12_FULL_50_11]|uniref:DUF1015 domain-containing protein n=1 Tax=Candidatus Edwardsbacteria bacterium GWF2_54_11 TaxID=1817851 RepID=A0A1F5RG45_9BACT|nr:MAG: hypothetical protein A2502_01210 [Candidatus Edwardsbacteria bacterium RifOxyC12_full_54_24]OGF08490.1 MAG: hypothetical protein A2273_05990 [Candidatus Edwardsbacteria bacterium RifOxyA12_full_54_48]OGF11445.1 MAG: hypothetical protein A3K15_03765 [Candidatus Edwardsbacteria bacterium GWE2_54_12]OGF13380.1 MAG: hypothetical protein A2024_00230 [Candidatus Edwardsbacteria bacterium GWF2_54_11]OGF16443.1 MAG: hypothetical protein A2509_07105 [Candidatus Edwardsbacteria bacterium RIFOXYD1